MIGHTDKKRGMSPDDAFRAWDGQTGIDGIYRDARGNYVIVESKATGGVKASDPQGCVARLCPTNDGRQMSDAWIEARLERLVSDPAERRRILDGLEHVQPRTYSSRL